MSLDHEAVTGLTPQEWKDRLEKAAACKEELKKVLQGLEIEMEQEKGFLQNNPAPSRFVKTILAFFNGPQNNLEQIGAKLKTELQAERTLIERYRSWLPGEKAQDRLFRYLKNFGEEVHRDESGLQFPGYLKYKGVVCNKQKEVFAFYLSERFPGRDPANFHLTFDPREGCLVIKRVYKMDLPRLLHLPSVGRAILKELIFDIVDSSTDIKKLSVDNAANQETRKKLLQIGHLDDHATFALKSGADPAQTPMGNLMLKLSLDLGRTPGKFQLAVDRFGLLKIDLPLD